jgi:KUP system potassium uptake protein
MQKSHSSKMLVLGAIGVVFGDIGTSPLYTLKECFKPGSGIVLDVNNILGILSLICWSITLVVSIKYVCFVMRADNHGEGGILSLMNLANLVAPHKAKATLLVLGLFGASMFYGDGVITPAISVLSAVEGMEIISPHLAQYVLPVCFTILFLLFWIQKYGTAKVGNLFGPIMTIWFLGIAMLGVVNIVANPVVLKALNPFYAGLFFYHNPKVSFIIFGSVFLALTGGEALYADMGHFGKKPIGYAWFLCVFPCLALNYLGQGALILHNPRALDNPFYSLAPNWALLPLVIMATLATVIASQAVISGAFSMTKQAINLGYLPHINIIHTSEKQIGQIYLPFINWMLFIAVSVLLFIFKSSDNLASAYGMAVVMTMLITTLLIGFVMRYQWQWQVWKITLFMLVFGVLDSMFLAANSLKFVDGGWIPLVFGSIIFFIMTTWKKGRRMVKQSLSVQNLGIHEFIPALVSDPLINRVNGTAVFLSRLEDKTPVAFMHNLKHNKVVHETVIFLSIITEEIPFVALENKLKVQNLGGGFYQISAYQGFKERPHVPHLLKLAQRQHLLTGWTYEEMDTSFFTSSETILPTTGGEMAVWREKVFAWMSINSGQAGRYFSIPANRIIEVGTQINL